MVAYYPSKQSVYSVNFRETAPAASTLDMFHSNADLSKRVGGQPRAITNVCTLLPCYLREDLQWLFRKNWRDEACPWPVCSGGSISPVGPVRLDHFLARRARRILWSLPFACLVSGFAVIMFCTTIDNIVLTWIWNSAMNWGIYEDSLKHSLQLAWVWKMVVGWGTEKCFTATQKFYCINSVGRTLLLGLPWKQNGRSIGYIICY